MYPIRSTAEGSADFDLLGVGVPMSAKVGAMCRPAAARCTSTCFTNGLGIDDRASMIGKVGARCRPAAAHCTSMVFPIDWESMIGKVFFPMDWASMIGKIGAVGRPPAAHCTSIFVSDGLGIDDWTQRIFGVLFVLGFSSWWYRASF